MKLIKFFGDKRVLLILMGLTILIAGIWKLKNTSQREDGNWLEIGDKKILVEIAKTPAELSQGLSGREALGRNRGMLFVFPSVGRRPFWMKEMKFDLDFVFIKEGAVVDLVESVPHPKNGEQPMVVGAKEAFDWALEIEAGTIERLGIKIGNEAKL